MCSKSSFTAVVRTILTEDDEKYSILLSRFLDHNDDFSIKLLFEIRGRAHALNPNPIVP